MISQVPTGGRARERGQDVSAQDLVRFQSRR